MKFVLVLLIRTLYGLTITKRLYTENYLRVCTDFFLICILAFFSTDTSKNYSFLDHIKLSSSERWNLYLLHKKLEDPFPGNRLVSYHTEKL